MRFDGTWRVLGAALCTLVGLWGGPNAAYAVGWSPEHQSLVVGDFDGDGSDDLFVLPRTPAWPCELITSSAQGTLDTLAQLWESDDCLSTGVGGHEFEATSGDFDGALGEDLLLFRREAATSFVYHANGSGDVAGVLTLAQQLPPGAFGFPASADTHTAHSGRFTADGNADLLLQGAERAYPHGMAQATLHGTFAEASPTWVDGDGYLGFVWSTRQVDLHVGDFNGDGIDDLLMVPSLLPIAAPGENRLMLLARSVEVLAGDGAGGFTPLERILPKDLPFSWTPSRFRVLVADFNGDGFDDIFLQAAGEGQDSFLLLTDAMSGRLASGTVTKIADGTYATQWSAESFALAAGDFSGTGAAQLYKLAATPNHPNELVTFSPSGAVHAVESHTPPTVPVPTPSDIAAVTSGAGGVSATGAAGYRVPIFMPVGTAGMVPDLALRYSSEGGNGLAGVGWSLDGMSIVSRCRKTIVHDGDVGAVVYAGEDRFCLDGQRLLLTSGDAYGAHGAEYRTELDSFVRIRSFDEGAQRPGRFEADLPNGERLTYGASADSRVEAGTSDGVGPVRAWALTKRCDRFDNCVEYRYDERPGSGEHYPDQILYTQAPSVAPLGHYRVRFQWEARPTQDVWEGFVSGYRYRLAQRLAAIAVEYRDDAINAGAPWSLVRAYDLAYHQPVVGGSGRSRLAYVQERAASEGNGVRHLPPIRFDWQVGAAGWAPATAQPHAIDDVGSVRIGDVNNDGFQDMVSAGAGTWEVLLGDRSGTLTPAPSEVAVLNSDYTFLADFDGDGTDDLLRPEGARWWLHLSDERTAFATAVDTGVLAEGLDTGGVVVADLTGDRLPDLVYSHEGVIRLRENTGAGFSSTVTAEFVEGVALDGDQDYLSALRESRVLDVDGDGRQDLLARVVTPPQSSPEWISPAGEFQQVPFPRYWQAGSTAWEL
ncbi:MAG: FG-GAP-like repeat-containing protein, partial [Pseudomonadota bacterium]